MRRSNCGRVGFSYSLINCLEFVSFYLFLIYYDNYCIFTNQIYYADELRNNSSTGIIASIGKAIKNGYDLYDSGMEKEVIELKALNIIYNQIQLKLSDYQEFNGEFYELTPGWENEILSDIDFFATKIFEYKLNNDIGFRDNYITFYTRQVNYSISDGLLNSGIEITKSMEDFYNLVQGLKDDLKYFKDNLYKIENGEYWGGTIELGNFGEEFSRNVYNYNGENINIGSKYINGVLEIDITTIYPNK